MTQARMKKNIRTIVVNWTTIDKIGKIKWLQSSIFVFILLPIIAQAIEEYQLKLTIPFNWLLLYYSTLFISLGTLLYSLFCPDLIKTYPTFESFQKGGRGGGHLYNQLNIFRNKKRNNQEVFSKFLFDEFLFAHHLNQDGVNHTINNSIWAADKESFWFVFDCLNYSRTFARILCFLFYLIGFALLTIVLCDKIYTVTNYFLTLNNASS